MTKQELETAKKKLGKHIKKLREQQGKTLLDVSAGCTLSDGRISEIEHGRYNISFGTMIELAKGLEVHPSKLLDY